MTAAFRGGFYFTQPDAPDRTSSPVQSLVEALAEPLNHPDTPTHESLFKS